MYSLKNGVTVKVIAAKLSAEKNNKTYYEI